MEDIYSSEFQLVVRVPCEEVDSIKLMRNVVEMKSERVPSWVERTLVRGENIEDKERMTVIEGRNVKESV